VKFFRRKPRHKAPHKLRPQPPLAWAQLSHQKVRLLVATTGVCFANILMFTQIGLLAMLTDGTTKLHESLGGDLFLVSSFSPSLLFRISFPRAYLYQASAVEGVDAIAPLYLDRANWVDPAQLTPDSIPSAKPQAPKRRGFFGNEVRVIAVNPMQPVFNLPEINRQLAKLRTPDAVLFDRLSQASLGEIPALLRDRSEVMTLMENRRVYVVGLFNMGSTLNDKGNVIISDWDYARRYGEESLEEVRLGVISLEKGADIYTVRQRLQASLPDDVSIVTREELIEKEGEFYGSQPEGVILKFGTIVGFVVGIIVIYQVLYTDISEHLSEYATLRAMGYSDLSLLLVVLGEALILGVMGFIPSYFASLGIYQLLVTLTRIPLVMKTSVVINVFVLTTVMCAVSGAIATRKLRSADPADVF
jgi:putative ABC transport system permease protein